MHAARPNFDRIAAASAGAVDAIGAVAAAVATVIAAAGATTVIAATAAGDAAGTAVVAAATAYPCCGLEVMRDDGCTLQLSHWLSLHITQEQQQQPHTIAECHKTLDHKLMAGRVTIWPVGDARAAVVQIAMAGTVLLQHGLRYTLPLHVRLQQCMSNYNKEAAVLTLLECSDRKAYFNPKNLPQGCQEYTDLWQIRIQEVIWDPLWHAVLLLL